jgi:hypothetical protein
VSADIVARNLEAVRDRIARVCRETGRRPDEVRLIAVSKLQPEELVKAAADAGQRDFAENHVQALVNRRNALRGDAIWHLVGHVQTNKAKLVGGAVNWLHTVDSVRIAAALSKALTAQSARLRALVQVNIAREPTKSGVLPDDTEGLLDQIRDQPGLELRGLMCIPEPGEGRRWFAATRELRDRLRTTTGLALGELSMGMSADYEDAIREGATMVRIGTALFGARDR